MARHRSDALRASGGRDSRLLAANLLADGISPRFHTNTEYPEEGVVASQLIELARGAGRPGIVHDLIPPREGGLGGTTGVEQRLTDLFRHYDFSQRRQIVRRGVRIQHERIPPATINGALGGLAWGAWVPENWSQSGRNPAEEMEVALRRGLASKAGGPLREPAAGWVDGYLGELIEHAALLGLDQVQSLTWMYCASRGRTWPPARHDFPVTLLYATPELLPEYESPPYLDEPTHVRAGAQRVCVWLRSRPTTPCMTRTKSAERRFQSWSRSATRCPLAPNRCRSPGSARSFKIASTTALGWSQGTTKPTFSDLMRSAAKGSGVVITGTPKAQYSTILVGRLTR